MVDDGETVDGHGQRYDEVESFSFRHHHHQRELGGGLRDPDTLGAVAADAGRVS